MLELLRYARVDQVDPSIDCHEHIFICCANWFQDFRIFSLNLLKNSIVGLNLE
jgi:hypothetical protein